MTHNEEEVSSTETKGSNGHGGADNAETGHDVSAGNKGAQLTVAECLLESKGPGEALQHRFLPTQSRGKRRHSTRTL